MSGSPKFIRKAEIARREIAGESFLIPVCGSPVDMENIFVLNPVAEFIWQRLDGESNLDEIVCEIVAEFDVSAERATADVDEFVHNLLQNHLVEERS